LSPWPIASIRDLESGDPHEYHRRPDAAAERDILSGRGGIWLTPYRYTIVGHEPVPADAYTRRVVEVLD
jgi:hypothetical protein